VSVKGDQDFFISRLKGAAPGAQLTQGQPALADLRTFFRSQIDDPDEGLKAYRQYVRAFYMHIDEEKPGGDIKWNKYCDSWTKIDRARLKPSADGSPRRVIDCEGYAFIAATLLPEAGWTLVGYIGFYKPGDSDSGHLAVKLVYKRTLPPGTIIGQDSVVTGTAGTDNKAAIDERNELFKSYPGGPSGVSWTDPKPGPKEATDAVEAGVNASEQHSRAPLLPRSPAGRQLPGGPRWA
jgi:hypothetical protein